MKIHKSRQWRINLGNYEHVEISAGVTVGPEDVGLTEHDLVKMSESDIESLAEQLRELADAWLYDCTVPELQDLKPEATPNSIVQRLLEED